MQIRDNNTKYSSYVHLGCMSSLTVIYLSTIMITSMYWSQVKISNLCYTCLSSRRLK